MKRRYRLPRDLHMCRVRGCATVIEHWKVLCDPCYRALPGATKAAIRDAREAKQPGTARALMIEGAAALATTQQDRAIAAAARTAAMLGERND